MPVYKLGLGAGDARLEGRREQPETRLILARRARLSLGAFVCRRFVILTQVYLIVFY